MLTLDLSMDCGCGCGCGCGGVAIAFYTSAVQMKKKSEKSGGKGEREWRACETTGESPVHPPQDTKMHCI